MESGMAYPVTMAQREAAGPAKEPLATGRTRSDQQVNRQSLDLRAVAELELTICRDETTEPECETLPRLVSKGGGTTEIMARITSL